MANIRKWLEDAEVFFGEQIEAIVVGPHDDRSFDDNPYADENVVLGRDAGLAKVDQEYDNGFGGADCYPMYAWTASRIFMIHEYDGATGLTYVPRNPTRCEPALGGGSIEIDRVKSSRACVAGGAIAMARDSAETACPAPAPKGCQARAESIAPNLITGKSRNYRTQSAIK